MEHADLEVENQELRQKLDKLRQSNQRLKDQSIKLCHEGRMHLTTIEAYANLINKKDSASQSKLARDGLERIIHSSKECLDLVSSSLEFVLKEDDVI